MHNRMKILIIIKGAPAQVVLDEAWKCCAGAIFLGANSRNGVNRLFSSGASATVASRAHCSVEVVRER